MRWSPDPNWSPCAASCAAHWTRRSGHTGREPHASYTLAASGVAGRVRGGPNHAMDWMTGISFRPGLVEEYAETTGAVLGGRDGFDAYPDVSGIYKLPLLGKMPPTRP
jgi:hypothetical protein